MNIAFLGFDVATVTDCSVGVVIDAAHQCMTTRGIHKTHATTITSQMLGVFRSDYRTRSEFMNLINS